MTNCIQVNIKTKELSLCSNYSSMFSVTNPKYSLIVSCCALKCNCVLLPTKQLRKLHRNAAIMYYCATGHSNIFMLCRKSRNFHCSVITPNPHSTEILTEDMMRLYNASSIPMAAFQNPPIKYMDYAYAKSLYKV